MLIINDGKRKSVGERKTAGKGKSVGKGKSGNGLP